jgi:hypothetical protein
MPPSRTSLQHWTMAARRSRIGMTRLRRRLNVDYCGQTVPVVEAQTGEVREAQP